MMTNDSELTVETKPPERLPAASLSTEMIPAAWQTPLPARTEVTDDSDISDTTTTLLPSRPFGRTARKKLSRKTKIIATLGPATESADVLRSPSAGGRADGCFARTGEFTFNEKPAAHRNVRDGG